MTYQNFFQAATGKFVPYDYQCRLACGEKGDHEPEAAWLSRGTTCASQQISIPTGLGKTAAVVLSWLWNRVYLKSDSWPRRLVYCLPMRTLVEQTQDEITRWLDNLLKAQEEEGWDLSPQSLESLRWLQTHSPIILMGGEDNDAVRRAWDLYPEHPAILIGTQDMLLSRALNRGYGMSRARWPMHFALLNNDALWIMDEIQLMGPGLATSAQLQAFRTVETHTFTWWMSATLQTTWLKTVDTQELVASLPPAITTPAPTDISKPLRLLPAADDKSIASLIAAHSSSGTTLVILNTVKRARAIYTTLIKNKAFADTTEIHLLHSRFRSFERADWRTTLLNRNRIQERPRVIIATQVVEAGVDISADTLITELAPWTSLVQRFGRAARYGGTANVIVLDIDNEKNAMPYAFIELEAARKELQELEDVSIETLTKHEQILSPERRAVLYPYTPDFLLLRHEVEDLFDTTPDLSGADLDISRYIRSDADTHCQIAWVAEKPASDYTPSALELCTTSIGETKKFVETRKNAVWHWDYLDGEWKPTDKDHIYPGLILVALVSKGGYSRNIGFDLASKKPVPIVPLPTPLPETPDSYQNSDTLSVRGSFQTIREHGEQVRAELKKINLTSLPAIESAALWHDLGKAHPAFQSLIKDNPGTDTAKAPSDRWLKIYKVSDTDLRPGFRHELASALALLVLRSALPTEFSNEDFDLLLYLVAAHHGKVRARLTAAPIDQEHPVSKIGAGMPIRGVMDGDVVPGASLGFPDATLSLDPSTIGFSSKTGASWIERVLGLLEKFGPFRLAYFETLLRAADGRASQSQCAH